MLERKWMAGNCRQVALVHKTDVIICDVTPACKMSDEDAQCATDDILDQSDKLKKAIYDKEQQKGEHDEDFEMFWRANILASGKHCKDRV